jgi:hypothetical protein
MRLPALLAVACLAAPAAAAEPAGPESLFPLAIGNAWTYRVSVPDGFATRVQDDRFVVRVADQEMVGSQLCFKLEGRLKDKVVATEHVAFTKAGLCRFRVEHEDVEPPVCILKVPGPSFSWTEKYALGSREATGRFLEATAPADASVPAGKFRAVKVEAWTGNPGPLPRSTVWYATGVGPVKQTINEGKARFELELEKFEKATGK